MRKTILIAACVLAAVLPARGARAAGFYLGEQDSVASARGLAVTAKLLEPSSIYFNPAGMAYLNGWNASLGVTLISPNFNYEDPAGVRAGSGASKGLLYDPHAYLTYTIGEHAAVGFGFNVPFGLALVWPKDFVGGGQIQKIDLKVPTLYFGLAVKPLKQLSIGATLRVAPSSVELQRRFTLIDPNGNAFQDGGVHLSASAVGVGASLGVMARPVDWLHIGFTYLSRMKLNFDNGEAHFNQPPNFDRTIFKDQKGSTALTTPDTLLFGIGADIGSNAYIEFDYNYTLWNVYKELKINFSDDPTGTLSEPIRKNWRNTSTYRLGFEYRFDMGLALRAAFVYDETPAPAKTVGPELPDSNRLVGSIGVGYLHRKLGIKVDGYYMFTYFQHRTVTAADGNAFPATYKNMAHLFGVTLGYASPEKAKVEPEKPLPPEAAPPPAALPPVEDPAKPATP